MSERQSLGQSLGRVKSIVKGSNYGFVRDFRFREEIFALFEYELQANPGALIAYEIFEQQDKGRRRLRAEDLRFNQQPQTETVLEWAREGLAEEGLRWLKLQIMQQPEILARVLAPPTHSRVISALLADPNFPLPASTIEKALASPRWRKFAAARFKADDDWTTQRFQHLLDAQMASEHQQDLVLAALQQDPELPLKVTTPVKVRPRRLLEWQRLSNNPAMLLLLPEIRLKAGEGWALLQNLHSGTPLYKALQEHNQGRSWRTILADCLAQVSQENEVHELLVTDPLWPEVLIDAWRSGRSEAALAQLKTLPLQADHVRQLLPLLPEEQREWLLVQLEDGGGLSPEDLDTTSRIRLYQRNQDLRWLRGLAIAELPADLRETLLEEPAGLTLLLEAGYAGRQLQKELITKVESDAPISAAARDWLAGRPGMQEEVENWLRGNAEQQKLALACLSQQQAFDRAMVQRLLFLKLETSMRELLVRAITDHNPERWQERYLLSAAEKELWQAAGAPLI